MRPTFTKVACLTGVLLVAFAISANAVSNKLSAPKGPQVLSGVTKAPAAKPSAPAAKPSPPAVKPSPSPKGGPPEDPGIKQFYISGTIGGLAPGGSGNLTLTIQNPNNFVIYVQSLNATVTGVDSAHSGCPTSSVTVAPYQGSLPVAKNGSTTQTLSISMSAGAPDACQGAQYSLAYGGTAVK